MSYVSPNGPLPPNNRNPTIPCAGPRSCETGVQNSAAVEAATIAGKATVQQTSSPASFVPLGLPIAKQVRDSQRRMNGLASSRTAASSIDARQAPTVLPLNVSVAEYSGCCVRATDPVQPQLTPQPRITIPQAPVPIPTPQGPMYIDAGPAPYMPPTSTAAILAPSYAPVQRQGLRVGAFYNAQPLGMRGLGAAWGDKGSMPCGGTWGSSGKSTAGGWLLLGALGVVGVLSLSKRR